MLHSQSHRRENGINKTDSGGIDLAIQHILEEPEPRIRRWHVTRIVTLDPPSPTGRSRISPADTADA